MVVTPIPERRTPKHASSSSEQGAPRSGNLTKRDKINIHIHDWKCVDKNETISILPTAVVIVEEIATSYVV